MAKVKKKSRKTNYKFKAELSQLLELIAQSLYKHPEIFMRELISNSSDALNKVRFRQLTDKNIVDPDAELNIKIDVNSKKKTFSIEDTGIGMSKDDLISNIGTVASSGTLKYLEQLKKSGEEINGDMIGKFGVGFYSVFMVTDEVTIETRHADSDSVGYRWISDGKGSFSIEEIDRKDRGTKITFKLQDDHKEYGEDYRIKSIIKKYSNFVDFPILINKEKENTVQALWRKPKDEIKTEELNEFFKFISMDYNDPLGHLHLSLEGNVNFKALIFIPGSAPMNLFHDIDKKGLHLYSDRVFIQDDAGDDLLPEYLRFIKGVVDTEDLPLNISRETTQHSPVMAKIKNILTKKILGLLEEWMQKDKTKFVKFYKEFGSLFKTGVNSDFTNKDKIMKLLHFESTAKEAGELVSLDDYVGRMDKKQKEIFYITGENREIANKNPNLEYFIKNDIEVLFMTDPVDMFVMPNLLEYEKKKFQSIEKADIDIKDNDDKEKKEALDENTLKSLIEVFKETLGDKVKDIVASKRLVNSPATLVVDKDGLDPQMERMMKMMNQGAATQKKILEINPSHKLVKNLSRLNIADSKDFTLRDSIMQIYEGALLIEDNLENPTEFIRRMTELMEKATS